jgi:hypothetical protein
MSTIIAPQAPNNASASWSVGPVLCTSQTLLSAQQGLLQAQSSTTPWTQRMSCIVCSTGTDSKYTNFDCKGLPAVAHLHSFTLHASNRLTTCSSSTLWKSASSHTVIVQRNTDTATAHLGRWTIRGIYAARQSNTALPVKVDCAWMLLIQIN